MRPDEIYRKLLSEITDEIVRKALVILLNHVGSKHRISKPELAVNLFGKYNAEDPREKERFERKARLAVEKLRKFKFSNGKYLVICSSSGEAGYWISETWDEKNATYLEFQSRADEMKIQAQNAREGMCADEFLRLIREKYEQPKAKLFEQSVLLALPEQPVKRHWDWER